MSVMVLIQGDVQPDKVDEFTTLLDRIIPETREFDGNEGINTYMGVDGSTGTVFVELWATRSDYDRYAAWRTETGVIAEVGSMLSGPPSITYHEDTGS